MLTGSHHIREVLPVTREQLPSVGSGHKGDNNLAYDALSDSDWTGNTVPYHGKLKYS